MGDFLVYTIGFPVTFVLLVLGMSLAARRILGLRVGLVRTALACLLAMSIASGLFGGTTSPTTSLATIQLGLSLLVVIGLLAFAEIIVPTGSIPPPTEWWGMARRRIARTRRYSRITAIAVRHGLGPYLRGRERSDIGLARSLRLALQDAGVTFVKLGQVLSTRADLLPGDFVDELSLLQDKVPPAKWDDVRALLDAELGPGAFTTIDPQPLAAASIAQVHRAVLATGAEVVVKVQRPDVRAVAEGDLDIPPEIAAVFRALATLEGTLGVLSPGFNIVVESRAFATEQITERLTPESVRRTMTEELQAVLPMLRRLPRRIDRITGAVEQGRLSMSMRLFADERDRSFVTGLLHQVMLTVLGATAGVMAVLLLGSSGGPQVAADVGLHQVFGYNLLIISVLLGLRVVVTVFRPRS
ncbi:AarF/UbiB family protein [Lentzea sp. NPDC059081]|uniref:AarF/UbiB family protein n=1 Tax=Lentzea sp. NPDC059081 TaxID=3346719 RepID=UPI0036C0FEB8